MPALRILSSEPVLDVASAEVGTVHAEGFEAEQRNTLRFDFFQASGQDLGVMDGLGCMAEFDMSEFVERDLCWQLSKRIDGKLSARGVALTVAVEHRERDLLDAEGG
jgi:hypothetical protein